MNQQDEAEQHLTRLLIHIAEVKRIMLLIAGLLAGWILIVNVAVFTDRTSAFRSGQELGFWDLVLSATQRMGFWLLSAAVVLVAWTLLTIAETYVAISAITGDEPDHDDEAGAESA